MRLEFFLEDKGKAATFADRLFAIVLFLFLFLFIFLFQKLIVPWNVKSKKIDEQLPLPLSLFLSEKKTACRAGFGQGKCPFISNALLICEGIACGSWEVELRKKTEN